MSFKELQEKVFRYESGQRVGRATEWFARFFASLFVMIGTLLAGFGLVVTTLYEPEAAAQLDMWVLSDMWAKITAFFETKETPIWLIVLLVGLASSLLAALLTVGFFFCAKRLSGLKKQPETEETLGNARELQEHFEGVRTRYSDGTNDIKFYLVFIFMSFLTFGLMEEQVGETENIVLFGFLCTILALLAYIVLRLAFMLPVQFCWKTSGALENEIQTALKATINSLERKSKAEQERRQRERLQKAKERDLKQADTLFRAFVEEESDDMQQLYQIAKLGHHDATLLLAEWCMSQASSPELTRTEQKAFLQKLYDALVVLGKYDMHCNVTKFLYYSTMMGLGKIKNAKEAQEALNELRRIKKSGDLSEVHTEICTDLIEALVSVINKMS